MPKLQGPGAWGLLQAIDDQMERRNFNVGFEKYATSLECGDRSLQVAEDFSFWVCGFDFFERFEANLIPHFRPEEFIIRACILLTL